MANLTLQQCDNCGFAEFTTGYPSASAGTVREYETGREFQICTGCLAHLKSRMGMYELTGDAKTPVKMVDVWPPNREQNEHPDGYTG
jgi:hypothetical protein